MLLIMADRLTCAELSTVIYPPGVQKYPKVLNRVKVTAYIILRVLQDKTAKRSAERVLTNRTVATERKCVK